MKKRILLLLLTACLLLTLGPKSAAFSDVAAGDWYQAAVDEMAGLGLFKGYPDGSFGPKKPITAAEFVTVTARCAGIGSAPASGAHWASGTLERALQAGWYDYDELPPTGEGYDRPIPRYLAAKILMRALFPDLRGDYTTESAKIRDFSALNGRYYEPVLAAYAAGLFKGDDQGNFNPKKPLTRAEACALFRRALALLGGKPLKPAEPEPEVSPSPAPSTPVARQGGAQENGWLRVEGTQLCNEKGEPIVLRGMSSHGLQWYGQFAGAKPIANTASFGANVFRLAMYTGEGGYLQDPDKLWAAVTQAADAAIAQDLYVIIDWHILSDGDPMANVAQAEEFFTRAARRYKDVPNVLYELCNEPNGGVTWEGSVRPYAQRLISAIRKESRGVILIGSPTWSQDIHRAAEHPLEGENLMYTLHFYAGTHGRELRDRIDGCLDKGLPIFVSEWGTSRADGSGGVFLEESKVWLDFLDKRDISWCNWSLCDKNETSAALKPGTSPSAVWTEEALTESGKFVFSRFKTP